MSILGLKVFAGWVLAIFGIVVLIGSISALAYMLWIGFKFFVDLSNDPDYDDKRTGLANDGDDWSPFPCVPEPEHKRPDIEQQVCQDILDRQKIGVPKYGGTVAESNEPLRAWLVHSYQEKLDDVIYMKRAIAAIDEQDRLDRDK